MAVLTFGSGISSSVPLSSTMFLMSVDMVATSGSTSKISPWDDFSLSLSSAILQLRLARDCR
eukprot:CAMPEP_0181445994 /NCGR_PEP_ID=MMETSP1110-20121109/25876_1 /TAXON_ID=174948 /ORGANISM="Symbiodinium sp., Strain CCMP421" /LENGTH=61 /DNA_ID=CAMNT_0023570059 /DNA_START=50 /DNA_END=235 /DNA_ORIENTATION=-